MKGEGVLIEIEREGVREGKKKERKKLIIINNRRW